MPGSSRWGGKELDRFPASAFLELAFAATLSWHATPPRVPDQGDIQCGEEDKGGAYFHSAVHRLRAKPNQVCEKLRRCSWQFVFRWPAGGEEHFGDAPACVAIPQRGDLAALSATANDQLQLYSKTFWVSSNQSVSAQSYRNRA